MNWIKYIAILICLMASAHNAFTTEDQQKHVAEFIKQHGHNDFTVFKGYVATQRGITQTLNGKFVAVRVGKIDSKAPHRSLFYVNAASGKVAPERSDIVCDENDIPYLKKGEIRQCELLAERIWECHALSIGCNNKGLVQILMYDPKHTSIFKLPPGMKPDEVWTKELTQGLRRRKLEGWYWVEDVEEN
jgi:hypothetical protein